MSNKVHTNTISPIIDLPNALTKTHLLQFIRNLLGVLLLFSFPISTTVTFIITCLYIPISLITYTKKEFIVIFTNLRTLSILLFIGINLISLLYTTGDINNILLTFKKYSKFLIIPLLIPVFCEKRWQHIGIISFLLSLSITVTYNYINFFFLHTEFHFKDRIYTSSLTAFGIFLLLWYVINEKMNRYARCTLGLVSLFFLYYLLIINNGRTGQIIFIPLMFVLIHHFFNKKFFTFILISIFLFSSLMLFKIEKKRWITKLPTITAIIHDLPIFTRFKEAYDESRNYLSLCSLNSQTLPKGKSSPSIRLEFYLNTLQLALKKPILGYGVGSFTAVYNKQYPERAKEGSLIRNPHNQFILTFMELGLFGLVALLFVFLSLLFYRFQTHAFERTLSIGLFYFMFVGCMINSWFLDSTSGYLFICFFAMSSGQILANEYRKKFI